MNLSEMTAACELRGQAHTREVADLKSALQTGRKAQTCSESGEDTGDTEERSNSSRSDRLKRAKDSRVSALFATLKDIKCLQRRTVGSATGDFHAVWQRNQSLFALLVRKLHALTNNLECEKRAWDFPEFSAFVLQNVSQRGDSVFCRLCGHKLANAHCHFDYAHFDCFLTHLSQKDAGDGRTKKRRISSL